MAFVTRQMLAIAWTMPPLVFPRSIQISRLLKALAGRGWNIEAVTIHPDSEDAIQDPALAERYNRFYRRHTIDIRDLIERRASSSFYNRVELPVRQFLSAHHDLPTDGWINRAERKASQIIRDTKPDVLVSFAQPWADHRVGMLLKRKFPNLPWIAHFSDPWADSPYYLGDNLKIVRERLKIERSVVENADAVIFVTSRTADLVMKKYPLSWRDKAFVIPHGYDAGLASTKAAPSQSKRLRIVHTGSFYPGHREPYVLMKALQRIRDQVPIDEFPSMTLIGSGAPAYEQFARELGLRDSITFTPRVGYFEALNAAATADALLIIDGGTKDNVFLPSKTVDYLGLGKPILALTPLNGSTADALVPLGHICVPPDDVAAIANALLQLIEQKRKGFTAFSRPAEFDIENVGSRFEAVMDSAIGRRKSQ